MIRERILSATGVEKMHPARITAPYSLKMCISSDAHVLLPYVRSNILEMYDDENDRDGELKMTKPWPECIELSFLFLFFAVEVIQLISEKMYT